MHLNPIAKTSQGKWQDPEWIERVCELALEFPEWGCDRIAYYLALKTFPISGPTVQRILTSQGLSKISQRRQQKKKADEHPPSLLDPALDHSIGAG